MKIFRFLNIIVLLAVSLVMTAQKKITPVDNDPNKPAQPTLHYYDQHGNPLDEPVLFMSELDTVKNAKPKPVYPLLYSANVGVNFFDGILKLFGQSYANYDIHASLSLFNWIEPVVEFGVGFANNHPEKSNFHYKSKPSFYGKIGLNYNFMYKSNPDYQIYLGIRGGFTSYSFDLTDVTINSDYWGQSNSFSILNQKSTAIYGQALAGLKVKIWKMFSLGWSVRYGFKIHEKKPGNANPWFVPGYGTGALGATFSLIYTIPINTKKIEDPIEIIGKGEPEVSGGIPNP